ncbi:MAG TPA: hypothetical protein VM370_00225 [Candidatus Thermoplasmatota archaeon]|nr:hypothetical protein [Candidatus Thermoplasmatota archaeon]
MDDRIENELFFATPHARTSEPSVAEHVFFANRPRPPLEVPFATRAAATPLRFALVTFLVGWAGILFQASLLQQVVFGAPVFEELAKFGPALLVVALVRVRSLWVRLPLAWASGAAFGVMEHFVTYPMEPDALFVQRVLFHAVSPGLSMILYGAVETLPDVRARWASTALSTLFHWANNFMAVVLGFASVLLASLADTGSLVVSYTVVGSMALLTLAGIVMRGRFEDMARTILSEAMPRLGLRA